MENKANTTKLLLILAIFALVSTLSAPVAGEEGCFNCVVTDHTMGEAQCDQVGDGETGQGIRCTEETILGIQFCNLSGGSCFFFTVDGGLPDDDTPIE